MGQRVDVVGTDVTLVDQIVPEGKDAADNTSVLRHFEIRLRLLHPRAHDLHSFVEIIDHLCRVISICLILLSTCSSVE